MHLFYCLTAFCLAIASLDLSLPAANAQPPEEDRTNDGNTLRLRPSEGSLPSVGGSDTAVKSMPEEPPAASQPSALENVPAERKAAVIGGVPAFLPKRIEDIDLDIRPDDQLQIPPDFATSAFETVQRNPSRDETWMPRQFMWQASEFWHRPLYFDDVPLERYGQMHHPLVQPALSGAHFFGTLPLLPYKMGVDRPCDEIATLGYYRPGSAAPAVGRRLPLDRDGAVVETATWVGLILLLP